MVAVVAIEMARSTSTGRQAGETSTSMARTLESAMVAPSRAPGVVVLESVDEEVRVRDTADPMKDLWLTTVDG